MTSDARPVFIAGLDRSGKTPLRRILDASSEIAFSRRSYLWTAVHGRFGDLGDDANLERCLRALERHPTLQDAGLDLLSVESRLRRGPRSYAALFALIGDDMARKAGRTRWGDQEGGVEERAEVLFVAFPGARVLHMVRDPRDRHLAIVSSRRHPGLLGVSITRWRRNARRALANVRRFPGRYRTVRFEDLAAAPAEMARQIGQFVEEPIPERLERAAIDWAAQREGTGDGAATVGGYRAMMLPGELRLTERLLERELRAFGYPIHAPRLSGIERIRYALIDLPLNGASAIGAGLRSADSRTKADKLNLDEVRR